MQIVMDTLDNGGIFATDETCSATRNAAQSHLNVSGKQDIRSDNANA